MGYSCPHCGSSSVEVNIGNDDRYIKDYSFYVPMSHCLGCGRFVNTQMLNVTATPTYHEILENQTWKDLLIKLLYSPLLGVVLGFIPALILGFIGGFVFAISKGLLGYKDTESTREAIYTFFVVLGLSTLLFLGIILKEIFDKVSESFSSKDKQKENTEKNKLSILQ